MPLLMSGVAFDHFCPITPTPSAVLCADLEVWRQIPDAGPRRRPAFGPGLWYDGTPARHLQPQAWWFDNCIQLYRVGQKAIDLVDVSGAHVRANYNWSDMVGFPMDGNAIQVLQQGYWWGANPALVTFAQTAVNQGIIACALERYRLASGDCPENLEQLMPAYFARIPRDVVAGRPMIYQRLDEGRYILRGVGPNEINDQNKKSSDDWLWTYPVPTNAPPTAATGGPSR